MQKRSDNDHLIMQKGNDNDNIIMQKRDDNNNNLLKYFLSGAVSVFYSRGGIA